MLPKTSDTIICMTENQVHDIQLLYKQQIQKKSIQLPIIYSLDEWLDKKYQEFCMVGPIDEFYSVLNGIEEQLLWEKIIQNDLKKKKLPDSQIKDITNKVIDADKRIRQYKINKDELKKNETHLEIKLFNEWREQFNNNCNDNKYLSRHSFIELFIEKQKQYTIVNNQELCLIGFDYNSPLHQDLIDTLAEKNKIKTYKNQLDKVKIRKIRCAQPDNEIKAVIEWIKINKKKKLLVISPALSKYQIKLQNEIDREIQPDIYKEFNKSDVYNSNLQRPLSNEPIIRAAINLLKLNNPNQITFKLIYESLLFNNWIDSEGYKNREQLANYINAKKIPNITIKSLKNIIKKDSKIKNLKLDSLIKTLSLIEKNQTSWAKKKKINEWISITEQYWNEIKLSKINDLLTFEINNLSSLFKSLNQLKINKIINSPVKFDDYWEVLFTQLENWPAPNINDDFYIDINGYDENPVKKYDAIWLMNMNENHWPGKNEFNPFIPKKLQKKYHIFDEVYIDTIDTIRKKRLENFGVDITYSHSHFDGETLLIPSPGYFDEFDEEIKPNIEKQNDVKKFQELIKDDTAPRIVNNINISGGIRCLENFQICPAWAFYETRLHASPFQENEQEEISKMSRGNLAHKVLENFWKTCKTSSNLAKMSEKDLKVTIYTLIKQIMALHKINYPYLTTRQIKLESNYLKDIIYQWLYYEKTERSKFKTIKCEESYSVKINRINFNVKIDRIDEYEDKTKILIDYKTGNIDPNPIPQKSPIKNLQIPIYTAFTKIKNISATGIGRLHNNNIKLIGLSNYTQDPIDGGLKNYSQSKNEGLWSNLINLWRDDIYKLAAGYLNGNASVIYIKEDDLRYCTVKPLLRIADKKWQFENQDE